WEEEECLEYYGMVSLHRLFEVVGAQLTPSDVAVLSFLLDEAHPGPRPRNGVELLLELERRGFCDEGNFRHLLQLLRVLTRHDLLHCVTLKRPRAGLLGLVGGLAQYGSGVSGVTGRPGPVWDWGDWEARPSMGVGLLGLAGGLAQYGTPHGVAAYSSQCRTGPYWSVPVPPPVPPPPADIRLRVRAELCEHDAVLRRSVTSRRPRGPGRQLDVFGQASGVLKSRDLGSILCDIKFSELSYLDAFWGDYLNGSLLEALKGVFLTEGLRRAVGREDVRLLVSVDQDDYEEGRRLLL
ncbi:DEDD protein, partial [Aramus guarauna]|nr:DEDD protein [Aramus guarauna]